MQPKSIGCFQTVIYAYKNQYAVAMYTIAYTQMYNLMYKLYNFCQLTCVLSKDKQRST